MPKVRVPKGGWKRLLDQSRRKNVVRRAGAKQKPTGLPPCPMGCGWTVVRDESKGELFCGSCGTVL